MKKLIIFNWKMGPGSLKEAQELAELTQKCTEETLNTEIVIAAPFVYLGDLNTKKLKNLKLGAQNTFWLDGGAYTGEISPKMLKNLGVEYVIIGHSERRKYLGETDEMINKKVLTALKTGLKVILCVGEQVRGNINKAKNYVKNQLEKDLKGIFNFQFSIFNLIIAYEPVWALSTTKGGHSDRPEDALEMIKFIKQILNTKYNIQNTRVLYGGSVDSKNIQNFLKHKEIDGVLVGGASMKINEVKKICQTKI